MGRQKVVVIRGGVVAPGSSYRVMQWDAGDPRVARLLDYRPNYRPESWANHADIITDLVLRLDHDAQDPLRDRHWAGSLHALFTWAEDRFYSTDPVDLLVDPRITEFIDGAYENDATKATHQYRLRSTAALIFPAPPSQRIPRNVARPPHTAQERTVFLTGAAALIDGRKRSLKTRRALHRDVTVILALTFGAGCMSTVVHRLRESCVASGPGGMWLTKPDQVMPVPINEPWASMIRAALTGNPDTHLVSPGSTGKRNERVGKIMFRARHHAGLLRGFDADRAAKSWQVQMLVSCGFDVVAALCDFRPATQTVSDLIPHLPQRPESDARDLARGWSL